jgi:uncharacterized DUF497 family protein
LRLLWDEPKRRTTLATRGLDFADITPAFLEAAVVRAVKQGRLQAIGPLAGRMVTVVFLPLGSEAVSIISMRRASRKERSVHDARNPAALR